VPHPIRGQRSQAGRGSDRCSPQARGSRDFGGASGQPHQQRRSNHVGRSVWVARAALTTDATLMEVMSCTGHGFLERASRLTACQALFVGPRAARQPLCPDDRR
jgi:hypothetical protein